MPTHTPGCSCDFGHDHASDCPRGRLIAAAPALLEALERVNQYAEIDPRTLPSEDLRIVRAAIALAKGETV